jgi:hypothetical protein
MLHRLFDQPSAATVTLARIHEPFEPSLFFCTIERGEVRVTSVNDGRKLTPWRRVKTDPLLVMTRRWWPLGHGQGLGL